MNFDASKVYGKHNSILVRVFCKDWTIAKPNNCERILELSWLAHVKLL